MAKRVLLFIVVNILVIITVSITMSLLGLAPYLDKNGIDYRALLIFCALFGFAGAFISLSMSRYMAKMLLKIAVIDPQHIRSSGEKFLIDCVYRFAQDSGFSNMPEVGIYDSPEVNAFATGPGKNSALVAVSTALLERMDREAIEGVIAHEMSHIANGDMVTMTLMQGVINTFVMFFARIAAWGVASAMRGDNEEGRTPYFLVFALTILFEICLSILGSFAVAWFSRKREFSADKNGAMLAGKDKMIYALQSLQRTLDSLDRSHRSLATLKISGPNMFRLLATHPPLKERISRLQDGY